MDLVFEVDDAAAETTLRVRGEIDVANASGLREKVDELLDNGVRQLTIDLDGVDFMDSTGLGVLVATKKKITALNGEFKLICHRPPILKVFEITGLDRVFTFVDPDNQDASGSSRTS